MASGLHFDPAQLIKGLGDMEQRTLYALETAGRAGAAKLERYAKTNAPWTDRSGLARGTIQGDCITTGNGVRITLRGNMHYMVYLELAMQKRWAILWPTVNKLGPEILREVARLRI